MGPRAGAGRTAEQAVGDAHESTLALARRGEGMCGRSGGSTRRRHDSAGRPRASLLAHRIRAWRDRFGLLNVSRDECLNQEPAAIQRMLRGRTFAQEHHVGEDGVVAVLGDRAVPS